jgi:hypothetical protein
MRHLYKILICFLFISGTLLAQDRLSGNFAIGLGMPFVELDQSNYIGYKTNLAVNAGVGYQFDASSRLRADAVAMQLNGNGFDLSNTPVFYQTQTYEGSISYEYNLIHFFDKKSTFKLNGRAGLGAGLMNANLFDETTRQRIAEYPGPGNDRSAYSLNTFLLLGANAGIPLSNKLDLNIGYGHRVLLFQPWVDAYNSESFDMYGVLTAGLTYYLKSDRDKNKIEVDPNNYDALKQKADSATTIGNKLNRQSEKVATLEMSNQEKDMQIELLNQRVDSLNTISRTAAANYYSGDSQMEAPQRTTSRQASTDLGATMFRVVIVSSPSEAGAQKFIDRSKLNKDNMQIAYIEKLDTYRVIYKSASTLAEAKDYRAEARKYYSDAWVSKF